MRFLADFSRKNWPEVRALLKGGIPGFVLAPRPRPELPGVPVFNYHLATEKSLARDLAFLAANHYRTLDADGLLAVLGRRQEFTGRQVVLSFDDGAANFYRVVFPLLRRHGMKAVLFIAPGLHREEATTGEEANRLCSWAEISAMHDSGLVDVQSHSYEHRSMTDWPAPLPLTGAAESSLPPRQRAPGSILDDLVRAREVIEKRLGKKVRHLAWPQFVASEQAVEKATAAGYESFWWGTLPHHPLNRPGDDPRSVVRLSGEFTRRLPGRGRLLLPLVLTRRYVAALARKVKPRGSFSG